MKRIALSLLTVLIYTATTFGHNKSWNAIQVRVNKTDTIGNEVAPQFKGGEKAFNKFLQKNIKSYPEEAKKNKVQGRVFIQFVVETNGSLTNLKIMRNPGSGLGDEALRVMNLSPKWIPGMQNGKPVRVQYTQPINFTLPKPFF